MESRGGVVDGSCAIMKWMRVRARTLFVAKVLTWKATDGCDGALIICISSEERTKSVNNYGGICV